MAKPIKEFYEYIQSGGSSPLVNYEKSPACEFLRYAVDAKDAMNHCLKHFSKKKRGEYNKASQDSLQIISACLLAGIMGSFETFQKYLFANMFEYSIYLKDFDAKFFFEKLGKVASLHIEPYHIAAYRDNRTAVGLLIAESLNNWHSPDKVDKYFSCFQTGEHKRSLYSNEIQDNLRILWQMRHSIVHTACTITIPDAQKVKQLNAFGNNTICLQKNFIQEVVRKFHIIIRDVTYNMRNMFLANLKDNIDESTKRKIENVFKVSSSCSVWLQNKDENN